MNFVVAMKQVPDIQQLRIRDRKPLLENVPQTYSKFDKNALEAAVQIKEQYGGEVIVVSVGNEELEDTVKEAIAGGGDRSYLVTGEELQQLESSEAAKVLAEVIKKIEDPGLILFSEGSADNYSGQVGSRVAEIMSLPQLSCVTEIRIEGDKAHLVRSLDDRFETFEVALPAVVIVEAGLNEPRIPSVTQVLKAGKKPKEVLSLKELGLTLKGGIIETRSNLAPDLNRKGIKLESIEALAEVLKAER